MKITLYPKYFFRSFFVKGKGNFYSAGYRCLYPECSRLGMTPWQHYVIDGQRKGYDNGNHPSGGLFFPEGYECEYPDVKSSDEDAWHHYANKGLTDGRDNGLHPKADQFFPEGYLEMYQDVADSGMDPWHHYVLIGKPEGRDCGLHPADNVFFAEGYLEMYPDAAGSGMDPWHHYVLKGKKEGHDNGLHPDGVVFFPEGYLEMYPDVAEAGVDPWQHYVHNGKAEGRDNGLHPNEDQFLAEGYVEMYPDVAKTGTDPWHHYVLSGKTLGRDNGRHPKLAVFIPLVYLALNGDVREAGVDPWIHYVKCGKKEKRQTSAYPYFDEKWYLENYPQIKEDPELVNGNMSAEAHYCFKGWKLGYDPSLNFDTDYYIAKYRDVRDSSICPLIHYISLGRFQNRQPYDSHSLTEPETVTDFPEPYRSEGKSKECSSVKLEAIENNALLIMLSEHLGDIIANEPVVRYLKWKYPERPVYWVIGSRYRDVVRYNPFISGYIEVNSLKECIEITRKLKGEQKTISLFFNRRPDRSDNPRYFWYARINGIDFGNYYAGDCLLSAMSQAAGLDRLNVTPIFWERPDYSLLSENDVWEMSGLAEAVKRTMSVYGSSMVILLHTKANETRRDWTEEKFSKLTGEILKRYPDAVIAELGMTPIVKSGSERFITMGGLTNLHLIYQIIKRADLFIGVDSSFMHMANASGTQAVCIIGKYGLFSHHCPYSGRFWRGEGVTFVRAPEGEESPSVGVKEVMKAVQERLAERTANLPAKNSR